MKQPKEDLLRALDAVRRVYRLSDVLVDSSGTVYLVDTPSNLERLVKPQAAWAHDRLLARVVKDSWNRRSYIENATHWDGLEYLIGERIDFETGEQGGWTVVPIPKPGWPRRQVWSVAKDREVRPEQMRKPPFDLCAGKPVEFGSKTGPVLLQLGEKTGSDDGRPADWSAGPPTGKPGWFYDYPPLFMAHGVGLEDLGNIVECGGLRWPSWALSWRVSPSYGDVVFLGDVRVVRMLAQGERRKHLYLAGTDIWSPAGRELDQLERAVNLERDGNQAWWSGDVERSKGGWGRRGLQDDLLAGKLGKATWESVVGTMSYSFGGDDTLTDPVKDRKRLVKVLDGILDSHVVGHRSNEVAGDPYVYPQRPEWDTVSKNRYPYMELKVIGKVGLDSLPAVFYPVRAKQRVFAALDQLGFQGVRVPYRWAGPWAAKSKANDAVRRRWAATVTQAILRWAETFGGVTEVWEPRRRW